MAEYNAADYPRLCTTTFFELLTEVMVGNIPESQKYWSDKKGLIQANLFRALIEASVPSEKNKFPEDLYKTYKPTVSKYLHKANNISEKGLPFERRTFYQVFDNEVLGKQGKYADALQRMNVFCNDYLDLENPIKRDSFAAKLLHLLEADGSIENIDMNDGLHMEEVRFFCDPFGRPMTKKQVIQQSGDIYLPSFLLGLWHFIVAHRIHNIGLDEMSKEVQSEIFSEYSLPAGIHATLTMPTEPADLGGATTDDEEDSSENAESIEGDVVDDDNSDNREDSSEQNTKQDAAQNVHIQIGKFIKGDDKSFNIGTINGPIIYHQGDS